MCVCVVECVVVFYVCVVCVDYLYWGWLLCGIGFC